MERLLILNYGSRRPYPPGRQGNVPGATHYVLGISLAAAAAVFSLIHHLMTP